MTTPAKGLAQPQRPSCDDLNISDSLQRAGMPPLDASAGRVGFFEFWPIWAFYAPVPIYWAWLSIKHWSITLPTAANPALPYGGLMGESKLDIQHHLAADVRPLLPRSVGLMRTGAPSQVHFAAAKKKILDSGLDYPIVAKPDMGCRGVGVQKISDDPALLAYIAQFPVGATMLLQELIDLEGEAGVMYQRRPGEKTGRITSLTLKYFPYVQGDGVRTLRELVLADPRARQVPHLYLPRHEGRLGDIIPKGEMVRLSFSGSHSKGAIFRDGAQHITPAMTATFDRLAEQVDGLHLVRFDVRFGDFGAFQRGEGFRIIEINGAGAEATHIWDSRTRLIDAWRAVLGQWRDLFHIGAVNRANGHHPTPLLAMIRMIWRENRLAKQYPQSH